MFTAHLSSCKNRFPPPSSLWTFYTFFFLFPFFRAHQEVVTNDNASHVSVITAASCKTVLAFLEVTQRSSTFSRLSWEVPVMKMKKTTNLSSIMKILIWECQQKGGIQILACSRILLKALALSNWSQLALDLPNIFLH